MNAGSTAAWWPRAALRRDEDFDQERKVTWLELFFDLVFVVVLSRLAHDLATDVSVGGVVDFVLVFAAVFWSWNAFTYYVERFESGGLEFRAFTFAAMATVAAMAVWANAALAANYRGFVIAFLCTRGINMAQWIRAARHVPEFRPAAVRFVVGLLVAAGFMAIGGQLDGGARRVVFALAVLIDIVTPAATVKHQAKLPQLSTSKFPERFGLFTIIVLGESIVGVVTGVSELNSAGALTLTTLIQGCLALATGIGIWWVYFDFIARRPPKPIFTVALAWVYLHLVTLAAITAVGAGLSVAIAADGFGASQRLLVTGAGAIALLGFAGLELTLSRAEDEPTDRLVSPALKAASGIVVFALPTLASMDATWSLLTMVVAFAANAAYGAVVWYSQPGSENRVAP